jgi:hypothetical protein
MPANRTVHSLFRGHAGAAGLLMRLKQLLPLSSRRLSPGSIVPQAPELADGWIPGTRPGMTAGCNCLHQTTMGRELG